MDLRKLLREQQITLMVAAVVLIVVVVGGICVINGTYSHGDVKQWMDDLTKLIIGLGIFGAGRAVKNGMNGVTDSPSDEELTDDDVDGADEEDTPEPQYDPPTQQLPRQVPQGVPVEAQLGHPDGVVYDPGEFTPEGVPKYSDSPQG